MSKVYVLVDERLMAAKNPKRSRHPRHFVVAAYSSMKKAQEAADGYLEALSFAPQGQGWKQGKLKGEITKTESSGKKSDKYGSLHATYRDDEAVLGHLRILTLTVNQPPEDEIDYMTAETFGAEGGLSDKKTLIFIDLSGSTSKSVMPLIGKPTNKSILDTWKEALLQSMRRSGGHGTYTIVGLGSNPRGGKIIAENEPSGRVQKILRDDSRWQTMGGTEPLTKELVKKYSRKMGGHTDLIYYTDALESDEYGLAAETFNADRVPRVMDISATVSEDYWDDLQNGYESWNDVEWDIQYRDVRPRWDNGAEQKGTTASGHTVEYDDGSIYIKFAQPILNWGSDSDGKGYDSVTGKWYGGDNESPDKFRLTVHNNSKDYEDFTINIDDVEHYDGVSYNKQGRWRIDGDWRGNAPDIFVDMSDELVEAIAEGVNWMVGDFEDYNAEKYGAESKFDKLAKEIAADYRKKGKSPEEALEIGEATAAKIGRAKFGKKKFARMGKKAENFANDLIPAFGLGAIGAIVYTIFLNGKKE